MKLIATIVILLVLETHAMRGLFFPGISLHMNDQYDLQRVLPTDLQYECARILDRYGIVPSYCRIPNHKPVSEHSCMPSREYLPNKPKKEYPNPLVWKKLA
jgi:hypothetical protein